MPYLIKKGGAIYPYLEQNFHRAIPISSESYFSTSHIHGPCQDGTIFYVQHLYLTHNRYDCMDMRIATASELALLHPPKIVPRESFSLIGSLFDPVRR